MARLRIGFVVAVSFLVVACVEPAPDTAPVAEADTLQTRSEALVYGADDRREVYELTSATELAVAASTTALVSNSSLAWTGSSWQLDTRDTFGASYGLCSSEPYRDQPNPAFCSGFQVGDDLIATAGHCIDASSCGSTSFVFGFEMLDASTVRGTFPAQDVYRCASIVARAETSTLDYAVVRVDRNIVGHEPLEVRRTGEVASGTAVTVSGHPAGLPMKVAGGATVRGNTAKDYFEANLDTYGGNSGSAVFNASTGVVEGILVRGNTDFVSVGRGRNRCNVSNECSDSGCPGWEDVTRTTSFAGAIPPLAGCTADAECDDGDPCNGFESCDAGSCSPGTPNSCGDGDACTNDACLVLDASSWECSNQSISCDDGNACTVDFCDAVTGCGSTPVVCGPDQYCSGGVCFDAPTCQARGDRCSSNRDCCSGKCRRRTRTCR